MRGFWKKPQFWILVIIIIAFALRFFRLSEYLQFLGDEGRDVLIVKRMIVDHTFTLLGPTASVGGFYTGPIYYYFMLPFLWLFQLDPVGPAVMAALFGVGTVVLVYKFSQELFGNKTAILAALLTAISVKFVEISRFSWNPNPVPFFSLLLVFCAYLGVTKKQLRYSFISGISYGILLQLHYTTMPMGVILGVFLLVSLPFFQAVKHLMFAFLGFLVGFSLFLGFEIRHNFPNIRSVVEFLTRRDGAFNVGETNYLWKFYERFRRTYEAVFQIKDNSLLIIYWTSIVGFLFWLKEAIFSKTDQIKAKLLLCWFLIGVGVIAFYSAFLTEHYFGYLYVLPIVFVAITLNLLLKKKVLWPLFAGLLAFLIYSQVSRMYFWFPPNNIVGQTKEIDQRVLELAKNKPFNFALLTPGNSDHGYRYFLELWGKVPVTIQIPEVDSQRQTVTSQLIVVCEDRSCHPEGNYLWEIRGFGPAHIVDMRTGPAGINIYKLVH